MKQFSPVLAWVRLRIAAASCALEWAATLAASQPVPTLSPVAATVPAFDSVMVPLLRVDWRNPLNPRFAPLGDDVFLFDTNQGVKLWDAVTNQSTDPEFAAHLRASPMSVIAGKHSQAMLGNAPRGAALVGGSYGQESSALWWWDGAARRFTAVLPLDVQRGEPDLLQLGPHHLLLCTRRTNTSEVVRLQQNAEITVLERVAANDAAALAALQATGVKGWVQGFGILKNVDQDQPLAYDVSHCGWEMRHAPDKLKRFFDPVTPGSEPSLTPYFLQDGRILLGGADYHDGKNWQSMNPPLLWDGHAKRWNPIEHWRGDGARNSALSKQSREPVVSVAFQSDVVEFLDLKTLRWSRSVQRLPEGYGAHVEPLSSGKALVLMFDSGTPSTGVVGQVQPMRTDFLPPGILGIERSQFDELIELKSGAVLLAGGASSWHPSTRVERVDPRQGHSQLLTSLPEQVVSAVGLELRDGTVLFMGGLPKACSPGYVHQCSDRSGMPSFRYFPQDDRWQTLNALRVPFERGPWWQTGNGELTSQWQRSDMLVRANGQVVWLGGAGLTAANDALVQFSQLMAWHPAAGDVPAQPLARLRKARTQASVVALADGRLAVIGGRAQRDRVKIDQACADCPSTTASSGPFEAASSTEVMHETLGASPQWRVGPRAHFAGGRAMRLANGRVFKLSLDGESDEKPLLAEVANASFTQWARLPSPPLKPPAVLVQVLVAGNRVVLLANQGPTIAWDDNLRKWLTWPDWPTKGKAERPVSITPVSGARALIRFRRSYALMQWP